MGCPLACAGVLFPRVTIFFIWVLTNWFSRAYDTWIWPVLGFLFFPYTTLVYLWAMISSGHVSDGWIVLIVIAVLLDIGGGITVTYKK